MYDASYEQIKYLQNLLAENGISQDELNLDNYAGLTYRELKSICDVAIKRKEKKANVD